MLVRKEFGGAVNVEFGNHISTLAALWRQNFNNANVIIQMLSLNVGKVMALLLIGEVGTDALSHCQHN